MTKGYLRVLLAACAGLTISFAQAETAQAGNKAFLAKICSDHDQGARHARFVQWLEVRLQLNDVQKDAFKAFQDARAASIATSQGAICGNKGDLSSFEGQISFNQTLLETRVEAMKSENPKLIAFYNTLGESQKVVFQEIRRSLHD